MPTNLPPEYFEAEKKFRKSETLEDKITSLEELLGTIPKHKGTDKLRADLRKKLSKLKESAHTKKRISGHESLFSIKKEGAGQVVLTGPVNTGKSSLLCALTNANPEISSQPHTTWKPTPGMMTYQDISIQLIDTPPLTKEFVRPELFDLLKRADLLALTIDLEADPFSQIGVVLDLLREKRIEPVGEYFSENSHKSKFILLVNKHDGEEFAEDYEIFLKLSDCPFESVPVSAKTGWNLDFLKKRIFVNLEVVRVYSKKPGFQADMKTPFVLKKGSNIEDFAQNVHQDFKKNLKTAKVWGEGVYDGQMVHKDHVLSDGDIVELHV
ncbi:TGS domain-containing protein [candidate division WOR-3 bacterium]|nr:TGS domain-containing protein [candidate division WOR-3 bacterium]